MREPDLDNETPASLGGRLQPCAMRPGDRADHRQPEPPARLGAPTAVYRSIVFAAAEGNSLSDGQNQPSAWARFPKRRDRAQAKDSTG